MANRGTTFDLKLRVNDKDVPNTLKELTKEFYKSRAAVNKLTEGTEEWIEANQRLAIVEQKRKEQIENQRLYRKELLKTIDLENERNQELKEFGENYKKIFQGIRNGDLIEAREGIKGIKEGFKGAAKAGLEFIATPLGAFLASLAAIALVTKKWFDYNQEVAKTIKITEQLTGYSGKQLEEYRASVFAVAETFDQDFNEVLKAANALAKQMGISQEEALDKIQQGFVRGANASGDFLDKVKEYPVQFKNAGFSAQDFIDITTQEVKGGIYDDKLIDAIKELDLSLKEMSQTQIDALENAFGKPFTEKITKGLKTGELTTKQALDNIIKKSNELGLNYQQQQQLVADLFKGAGEDAGGFAEIILQLNEAFDDQNKELNQNEVATQRLAEANKEAEKALADLFDASQSGFPSMLTNLKSVYQEMKTGILKGLKEIFTSVEQLKIAGALEGQSDAVKRIYENMKKFGTTAAEEAQLELVNTAKQINRVNKIIAEGNDSKIYQKKLAEYTAYYDELLLIANGKSKLLAEYEASQKPEPDITNPDADPPEKEIDKEAQKRADKEKAIREKVREKLKEWEKEREIEDALEQFEKDKREEERELLELENKFAKLAEQAQGEKELLAELEEEKLAQIQDIRDKYSEEKLKKDEAEKKRLAEINKKFADELIAAEENLQAAKENAYASGISSLKGFFSNAEGIYMALLALEKGLAINEIIVNASKAIALAQANHAAVPPVIGTIPNIMWPISLATMTKNIAATKITAAAQIASVAASTLQGFFTGGDTGNSYAGFLDRDGRKVAGLVHQGEYVIPKVVRQDPEMPMIENYIEKKRRKKLGLYQDGGPVDSETPTLPASGSNPINDPALAEAIWAFIDTLSNPIQAQVFFGFEAEEKRAETQRKLEKIKNRSKVSK